MRPFLLFSLLLLAAPALAQAPEEGLDADYLDALEAERAETDAEFRDPAETPLDPRARAVFEGVAYWPTSAAFVLEARLERDPTPETVLMSVTVGEPRPYTRLGRVRFQLGDHDLALAAFESEAGSDSLFIPFTDATSGRGSYGGGRYLSVLKPEGDALTLDFNRAYSPYCAYSPLYSCPVPPAENALPVAIEAGEMAPPAALADALQAPWPEVWERIEVETGGFAVAFPFAPDVQSPRPGVDLLTLQLGDVICFAASIGLPRPMQDDAEAARALAAMVAEFARDPNATILRDEAASLDGAPARALAVEMQDGSSVLLWVAVDTRRVYRVGTVNGGPEVAQRLFEGFERLAPSAVPPPSTRVPEGDSQ